jgi:CRP/FNR family cyclic AMP-dependent transcriptional regulator
MDMFHTQTLSYFPLFAGLHANEMRELDRATRWLNLQRGEELLSFGQTNREVYFLASGELRSTVYTANGRAVQLRRPPDAAIFGYASLCDGLPSPATVEAVEPSLVAAVRGQAFMSFLARHPHVYPTVMTALSTHLRVTIDQVVEVSTLGVRARLHAELQRMCRAEGADGGTVTIAPSPTHSDLAARVGTNRETVSRELSRLQQAGVVARVDGNLIIPDLAAFNEFCSGLDLDALI